MNGGNGTPSLTRSRAAPSPALASTPHHQLRGKAWPNCRDGCVASYDSSSSRPPTLIDSPGVRSSVNVGDAPAGGVVGGGDVAAEIATERRRERSHHACRARAGLRPLQQHGAREGRLRHAKPETRPAGAWTSAAATSRSSGMRLLKTAATSSSHTGLPNFPGGSLPPSDPARTTTRGAAASSSSSVAATVNRAARSRLMVSALKPGPGASGSGASAARAPARSLR